MADKPGETTLSVFTPPYMIDMFAAQRALVLDRQYDGAGTCRRIVATPMGVLVTFASGTAERRMLVAAHGWGWVV